MIKIKQLCAGYHDEEVLHHIDLSIESGKVTVIIGPNGSGKSTLLKTLIHLNSHTAGTIEIDGVSIESLKSSHLSQKIAYLPQKKNVPDITVNRMVLHGRFAYLKYPRHYRKQDYEMVEKAMKWVGIEEYADRNVNQLSGGMQQKVYIAMALAQDTPTILMDEPTVYLDIAHQIKLMTLSNELASQGKAIVMVLHDLTQAFRYADRIIVMSEGRIVVDSTPEEIYNSDIIKDIFHVRVNRMLTNTGWQYFYE